MFNIYLNEKDLKPDSKYPVIALLNEAANDNLIEFLKNIHDKVGSGYNYSSAYFWDELDDYDKENTDMFSGIRIETEGGEKITVSIEEIMYYMNILIEKCQLSDAEKEEVQRIISGIVSEN